MRNRHVVLAFEISCVPLLPAQQATSPVAEMQAGQTDRTTSGIYMADQFKGADLSERVNACLAAAASSGGGTCDARRFPACNIASHSITVGDGKHRLVLLLPVGTIVFASGQQLIYRSYASIVGSGFAYGNSSSIVCTNPTGSCVQSYNEGNKQVLSPSLMFFSINSSGRRGPESVGLNLGGAGNADVLAGNFSNLAVGGFATAVQMGGAWGCSCYNHFNQIDAMGSEFGVSTRNFSHYAGDFNSNIWTGGRAWGKVGLNDVGGGKNKWIGIDIEGARTHGMILGGYGNMVIGPYFEANGCDLINGHDNMVIGPLYYGGGAYTPCRESTSTTDMMLGPDATPTTFGVRRGILFGSPFMNPNSSNGGIDLIYNHSKLELMFEPDGQMERVYGYSGAAPFVAGNITADGGFTAYGRAALSSLADPPAPTITQAGTPGTTTYQYRVVCHDWNGGTSLASSAGETKTGNAHLDASNYNIVTWDCGSGYLSADILKLEGSGWVKLSRDRAAAQTKSSLQFPFKDIGQASTPYSFPIRNTTADFFTDGFIKAKDGYQSSDGTPGFTGTCPASSKLVVKNGLITGCS
ncbi:MAG: hypothetical protein KGN79_15030 [Acidobacteriota bacterium]|nr:hypothetical protein [Acidobacteriota bacterium]